MGGSKWVSRLLRRWISSALSNNCHVPDLFWLSLTLPPPKTPHLPRLPLLAPHGLHECLHRVARGPGEPNTALFLHAAGGKPPPFFHPQPGWAARSFQRHS